MQNLAQKPTHSTDPVLLQTNVTTALLLWQQFIARFLVATSQKSQDAQRQCG